MRNKLFNWVIIVVGIVLIVNISRSILDLSGRGRIVEEARLRVKKAEEENILLREKYYEVTRDEYVEKIAREKLGLGKEGEVVVVLPKEKIEATGEKQRPDQTGQDGEEKKIWRQWLELFL